MQSPPTPLAIRADDVESLWLAVSRRLDNTSNTIMRQLHALQAGMVSHIRPHGVCLYGCITVEVEEQTSMLLLFWMASSDFESCLNFF
jgi:hypothetical protein